MPVRQNVGVAADLSSPPDSDLDAMVHQILAVDWACYSAPAERADFTRLRSVVAVFPQGFRIYYDGAGMPVGYTGWYPIGKDIFDRLHDAPDTVKHRGDMKPLPALAPIENYIYFFNYSIVAPLRQSAQSRQMMQELARTIDATPHAGLSAVSVSADGIRVAERFGMRYRGDMTHDGDVEGVYAVRF